MVSTSEVVCSTSTPRDIYFRLFEYDGGILEERVSEAAEGGGYFCINWRKGETQEPKLKASKCQDKQTKNTFPI